MSGRRKLVTFFMLCALLLSASSVSYAFDYSKGNRQYYVLRVESDEVAYDVDGDEDDHQTDGGQYSSSHWDEPYPKHADSLNDLFALMISGDNVYFLGDVSFDVSSTIEISKDLNLYGSFPYTSGNNGKFEERNIKTRPTTFDAQNERRVFHITGGAKVTLDSLKITGGSAYTDNGGVYVEGGCNIVVRSCDVVSNGIDNAADGGRGITIIASTALIENCLIADNVHKERCSGVYADSSDVVIRNCTFTGNVNHNDGGCGISLVNGTTASVSNCTITENEGRSGTGIYVNASRLNIQSCDISNNKNAATYGCGIALDEGSYAYIFNCTITSNDTLGYSSYGVAEYGDGGGIAVMGISSADIVSCDIFRNTGGYGGGVFVKTYNAGGKSAGDGISSVTIKDCKISDNFSGHNAQGGGIHIASAAAAITDCTISGNVVSGENWANIFGGGIYVEYPKGPVTITDCVITGNFANADGGGIYTTGASYTGDCSPVIKNCLISGNTATRQGGGIYVGGVYLVVDNCTITGNKNPGYVVASGGTAGDEHGGGGGIYVGDAALLMTNSTVTKNSTYYGSGGGGIYYSGTTWSDNMISNCSIVDNSARNGGVEIQRDGYIRASRIPFINSLIYNPTSPDRSFVNKDSERSMFFNCAIPESLALPSTSPSFDIVKIASWNPVSSTETINGITHTVYRIEDNPALKPIVGAGANRVVYSNSYYTPDVNYTSPSFDQLGTTRVNSPDIGAMEKAVTVPVLSADASIHVVVSNEIDPLTIADTEPNKALTWTVSGDVPSGVTASEDANGMTYTLSGAPAKWGDYSFSVIASNAKGSDDVKVSVIVYTAPVLSDDAEIKAVKGSAMSQTFPAVSGNHLVWTVSGDVPSGLSVSSGDDSFTVSGTPSTAGDYSFTLTASNMAGSDDIAVNVTVYEMPLLPDSIITLEASKDFALVEQNVTAAAGNHLTWSVDGTLPAGITVYSEDNAMTATIMGTPTKAGDYDFSIVAGNYAGSSSIEVRATVYEAPEISGSEIDIQAVEGRAFSAREIPATAGNHLTWTRTGTFPDGLTFSGNDSALSISGTPGANSAGRYESTFTASNPAGSASVRVRIFVSGKNFVVTSRDVSSSTTLEDFLATLSPEQAAAIETLTLNEYFTDLSGLGTLTALKELDVSKATALKEVNLGGNKSVTALKVSGNESVNRLILSGSVVETVNAEGCTGLGSVEIAGNTSIRELNVSGSAVEILNVEDCVNLETLLCSSCKISEFYLAGCTSLVTLDFSGNAIRKFNARGFPELESLDCISQTVEVDALRRNFAFREFMDAAKVSFVEGVQTLSDDPNVRAVTGYDASGNEISADYDGESGVVSFPAVPHKIEYVYMVLDGVSMDVLISGDAEDEEVAPELEGSSFTVEATEGRAVVARTIAATAGDNLTWTTSGDLPRGMAGTADSDGRGFTISGTPATGTAGTYTITVTATNTAGSAAAIVTVNVSSPVVPPSPSAPVLSGQSFSLHARENEAITALTVTAISGDNLTWTTAGTLPSGLTGTAASDAKSFTISGTPSAGTAGSYTYTVTARNSAGESSASVSITVSRVINTQEKNSLSEAISQLTDEQAEAITDLAVGGNITDLSGLGRLTNLETLDLTEAESLSEVNISGNKTIKELNASSMNISSLNASGCENLEVLDCSSCRIDRLNLEGCVNLRELDFRGNAIRRFRAGGFSRLEALGCSGQRITGQVFTRVFSLRDFLNAAQVSEVSASDADDIVRNVKGYDSSGHEIESQYNEATGEVTFASAPSAITYDYDTGFGGDDPYMDVTVTGTSSGGEAQGVGSSTGGCDAGFASFAALLMSAVFVLSRKD